MLFKHKNIPTSPSIFILYCDHYHKTLDAIHDTAMMVIVKSLKNDKVIFSTVLLFKV